MNETQIASLCESMILSIACANEMNAANDAQIALQELAALPEGVPEIETVMAEDGKSFVIMVDGEPFTVTVRRGR